MNLIPTPEKSVHVFIVDDVPANLSLLRDLLETKGYKVSAFPSGNLALKALRRLTPDLILLDVMMPEMDGFQLCERLRADTRTQETPVIFMSALDDTESKLRAFDIGGSDYVTKPFREKEILARIDRQLQVTRQHMQIVRQSEALHQANLDLRKLERQRDDFVQMLVHDLRSPLHGMVLLLDIIQEEMAPKDRELSNMAAEMSRAGHRLLGMVGNVLDISRMENGMMPIHPTTLQMQEVAQDVVTTLKGYQLERGIEILVGGEARPCLGDRELVRRVLENFVSNGLKYAGTNGWVAIQFETECDHCRCTVSDNGAGIPEIFLEKIFEKYAQAEQKVASTGKSSGLGLAFCKLAVEAMGGEIGAEIRPGKGGYFWFRLPLAD
jgi:signal transduction histidine kinase